MASSTRTEQIWIQQHKTLSWLCHLSKNLYNEGNYQIRQELFKHNKWMRYNALYHRIKTSKNYHQLPAQTAQQVLKILDRSWKAFFRAIKAWKNDKSTFKGRPKPPEKSFLKKTFLNAVDADRIEDVGLHPTRWRLAAATS